MVSLIGLELATSCATNAKKFLGSEGNLYILVRDRTCQRNELEVSQLRRARCQTFPNHLEE